MSKVIAFVSLLALILMVPVSQAGAADGKEIFLAQKCNMCHSIDSQEIVKKSEKMKGAELSDVGSRVTDAAWLKGFLTQTEMKDGEKHKKKFKGTDEELDTLVTWILSLKSS
jgi:cytochrome c2